MTRRLLILTLLMLSCILSIARSMNDDVLYLHTMIDKEGIEKTKSFLINKEEELQVAADILGIWEVKDMKLESKPYQKNQEKYIKKVLPMPLAEAKKKYTAYFDDLYFLQPYSYPNSDYQYRTDKPELKTIKQPNIEVQKVFYADGTTGKDLSNRQKPVDSLRVKINYELIEKYAQYEFNNNQQIEGGSFVIDTIADNYVRIVLNGNANKLKTLYAINADGGVLKLRQGSRGSAYKGKPITNKDRAIFLTALNNITKLMERAATKDTLKKLITRELKNTVALINPVTEDYYEAVYEGNISSLAAIVVDKKTTEIKELTLKNPRSSSLKYIYVYDEANKKYGFVDATGKITIAPTYEHLKQLNNRYYARTAKNVATKYYYLSETENKLIPQEVDSMKRILPLDKETKHSITTNNKGIIAYKNGKTTIMNQWCKPVNDTWYDELKQTDKECKTIEVRIGENWGKIDCDGKILIPIKIDEPKTTKTIDTKALKDAKQKYDTIDEHKYGLALVSKDGLYGFVNEEYEEIIAPVFAIAYPLHEGITMVIEDNWRILGKIIDHKGNTIVSFGENPYMEEKKGERIYSVSDIQYNAKGEITTRN